MKIKEIIVETPYLNNEELSYKSLSSISKSRVNTSYELLADLGEYKVYQQHSNSRSVIAGKFVDDDFYVAVQINTRVESYPVKPTQLDSIIQVSMVNVASGSELAGLTKRVYDAVGHQNDLISDHEQYLGAQGLWKSLARSSDVNVYVFDGRDKDYVRDEEGKIIKYNGKNISDKLIWGNTELHRTILLVATKKDLT